jgi:asparagine synthase (glutamine-hydrolysing)
VSEAPPVPFTSTAGFLAVSGDAAHRESAMDAGLRALGAAAPGTVGGDVLLALSGVADEPLSSGGRVALLAVEPRRHERTLSADDVAAAIEGGPAGSLREVLPPFAAAEWGGSVPGLRAAVDTLGFRHLYQVRTPTWAALSTSARALARCAGAEASVDRQAIAVQSLLGWQIGLRTPFSGVSKVPAGSVVSLGGGSLSTAEPPPAAPSGDGPRPSLDAAIHAAAAMLRGYLTAFLDEHPDAVLQLTGGQDSRILLGAVPPERRRGLEVMTLAVPGSPDVAIAADLARTYGMRHQVVDLGGLEDVDPGFAHDLVVAGARRLDCSADPVAWASIAWAEAKVEQRPRLAGLGGEVARGFYYFGPPRSVPVTPARVERLARWRMFTNEAVAPEALDPEFAAWARATATQELHAVFDSYGPDWLTATDEFYLRQRMHRWAGVLASATSLDRVVVNPMLDDRFVAVARALRPSDKRGSLFLSRLSCALDDELSRIPLDGRPAPAVYAHRGVANSARLAAMTGGKIAGKVRQRIFRVSRPPAGGDVLAEKLTSYYRADPAALDGVRSLGVFRTEWLDALLSGGTGMGASTAAMLVTLEVATDVAGGHG